MVNRNNFQSEYEGYKITVKTPSYWWIIKNTEIVDCCFYHPSIARNELQCKVQAEKAMDKILECQKLKSE